MPQLRSPESASGTTGNAGYYNLLPFAGLVPSGSAAGFVSVDLKYRILSESSGRTVRTGFTLLLRVPIHKGIDFLMTHSHSELQTCSLALMESPTKASRMADVYWNAGYLHIGSPLTPVCFGFEMRYLSVLVSPHLNRAASD